ncbi:MAG: RDD family protein [Bacilli bacterium]|nr:RDD family protein [Bacilli bacterium]
MKDARQILNAKPKKRVFALLFDFALLLIVAVVLLLPSIFALANVLVNDVRPASIVALWIASGIGGAVLICVVILYFVALPVYWDGQTIGKRFMGIRIIDKQTLKGPSVRTMFLRETTRIVTAVLTLGFSAIVSLIALCVNPKHTTFHEEISMTRVVDIVSSDNNKESF